MKKYKAKVEEKVNGKPVDILIKRNDTTIILEITSLDMYNPIKYS